MDSRADTGLVCVTLPATTATTAIQKIQPISRLIRNLVQSDIFRCVVRSTPPKNLTVQNR